MPVEKQPARCQGLVASEGQETGADGGLLGSPAEPYNSLWESSALAPTPGAVERLGCCSLDISIRVGSKGCFSFQISERSQHKSP